MAGCPAYSPAGLGCSLSLLGPAKHTLVALICTERLMLPSLPCQEVCSSRPVIPMSFPLVKYRSTNSPVCRQAVTLKKSVWYSPSCL